MFLEVVLHLVQLEFPRWNPLIQFDDVIAVLRRDDVADLVGLEGEGGRFELRHHLPVAEGVFAALVLRARIFRILPGQRGKVLAFARPFEEFLDLLLFLFLLLLAQFLVGGRIARGEQDVRRADRFLALELLAVLVVEFPDLIIGDGDFALQLAVHDLFADGAFEHLGVELRGREIHRPELAGKRFFRTGLFLGAGDEFVGGRPGFFPVVLRGPDGQQLGDDQPVEQLGLDLFPALLGEDLSARVQVCLELQKGLIQLAAPDFDSLAFDQNIVREKLPRIGGGFGCVFFCGPVCVGAGCGDCRGAQEGHQHSSFHFIFQFALRSLAHCQFIYNFTTRTLLMSGSVWISSSNPAGGTLSRFNTVKAWPPLLSRLRLILAMLTLYLLIKVPM